VLAAAPPPLAPPASEPVRAAVEPAPSPLPAAIAPATIVVEVETTPPGARVIVGDELRGTTPLGLELPRSSAPVAVALELEGHQRQLEEIVPDVPQRLRITLERERRRSPGPRPTKSGDGSEAGFFRFE
jgi:hypothetical protein